MKEFWYKWLPIIFGCHCRDDRSFYYKGQKFPICARCTGELVGIIISFASCGLYRPSVWISCVLMIPLILDGVIQMFTTYESNNTKRFVTGLLFGYGLCSLFIISTIAVFEFGKNIGYKIKYR